MLQAKTARQCNLMLTANGAGAVRCYSSGGCLVDGLNAGLSVMAADVAQWPPAYFGYVAGAP